MFTEFTILWSILRSEFGVSFYMKVVDREVICEFGRLSKGITKIKVLNKDLIYIYFIIVEAS